MQQKNKAMFSARARYVSYSPYKLRPIADVVRGKNAAYALGWLTTYKTRRSVAIKKLLESAVANARHLQNIELQDLIVKEFRIDQGPIHKYFKPGAQGRAMPQRRRTCHMDIVLEVKKK